MNAQQAQELVIFEGLAFDGVVVEARAAIDPGAARMEALRVALALLAQELSKADVLDRRLAAALYALSFYLSESVNQWQACEWISTYTEILEHIDSIFCGEIPDPSET